MWSVRIGWNRIGIGDSPNGTYNEHARCGGGGAHIFVATSGIKVVIAIYIFLETICVTVIWKKAHRLRESTTNCNSGSSSSRVKEEAGDVECSALSHEESPARSKKNGIKQDERRVLISAYSSTQKLDGKS